MPYSRGVAIVGAASSGGTLGKTAIGGSVVVQATDQQWCNKRTMVGSGTVVSMSMYLDNTSGFAQSVDLAIWADSAGAPGALLASSGAQSISGATAAGWKTYAVSLVLAAGDYWLGAGFTGDNVRIRRYYDVVANAMRYRDVAGVPTNPFGSASVFNNDCSVYATYS